MYIYKCRTPAGLSTVSWDWGLPTPGCLCKALPDIEYICIYIYIYIYIYIIVIIALPDIEQVLRPTGVWQKGLLELMVVSDTVMIMIVVIVVIVVIVIIITIIIIINTYHP